MYRSSVRYEELAGSGDDSGGGKGIEGVGEVFGLVVAASHAANDLEAW